MSESPDVEEVQVEEVQVEPEAEEEAGGVQLQVPAVGGQRRVSVAEDANSAVSLEQVTPQLREKVTGTGTGFLSKVITVQEGFGNRGADVEELQHSKGPISSKMHHFKAEDLFTSATSYPIAKARRNINVALSRSKDTVTNRDIFDDDVMKSVKAVAPGEEPPRTSCWTGFKRHTMGERSVILIFFVCLAVLTACCSIFLDYSIYYLEDARRSLVRAIFPDEETGPSLVIWALYNVMLVYLTTLLVQYVSPFSTGSGIPEMNCILNGNFIEDYVSPPTLLVKVLGIALASGGGLFIGRAGPFVQISIMAAYLTLKVPFFRKLNRSGFVRTQLLATACACSFGAVFGAPIGGVIFSVEVTQTYFLVSNLWKGFFVAIFATIPVVMSPGSTRQIGRVIFQTDYGVFPYWSAELFSYAVTGVLCGGLGALFVRLFRWYITTRKRFVWWKTNKFSIILIVSIVTSCCTYPLGPFMRQGQGGHLNALFRNDLFTNPNSAWFGENIYYALFISLVIRFILTLCSVTSPIPAGVFVPTLVLGALLGRVVGEVVAEIFPDKNILKAGYAVVGAAACTAGVTQAMSTAVILIEATSDSSLTIPIVLGVVMGVAVSSIFTINLYDVVLEVKRLPVLKKIHKESTFTKVASDVMRVELDVISEHTYLKDIVRLLSISKHSSFPVIDSSGNEFLRGYVFRRALEEAVIKGYFKLCEAEDLQGLVPDLGIQEDASLDAETMEKLLGVMLELSSRMSVRVHLIPMKVSKNGLELPLELPLEINLHLSESLGNLSALGVLRTPSEMSSISGDLSLPERDMTNIRETIEAQRRKIAERRVELESGSSVLRGSITIFYEPSPVTILEDTPLSKVHYMFVTLGLNRAWVLKDGSLTGVVTKRDLIDMDL